MLEQKIEELSARVAALTAVMEIMIAESDKSTPPAVVEAPAVKAEAPAPEEKVETRDPAPRVDRDALQDLCMTIVREDRSKKSAVKDAIAKFGGAATLKAVPEADLAQLKADLEALV